MRVNLYRPVHVKTLMSQKQRALLTARKLLQEKAIAIENDMRGLLRNFGTRGRQAQNRQVRSAYPRTHRKTVCPPLPMRWLALHCASEGCSGGPSRSSPQADEPWRIIEKHLSESMLRS